MRQQDKILSRQKTRLNPIKSFIAPVGGMGKQNYRIFMIALQTGSYATMQKRLPHCMNKCSEFLPFRSSFVTSYVRSALVSLLITNAKLLGQILGKEGKKKKKQAVEYSVIKMWWKGRYSTHIHISVIWFRKKQRVKGKTQ